MGSPANSTGTSLLNELNSHVLLYNPPMHSSKADLHPSVILVFGWMDARLVHLQKYVDSFHSTFPTSKIVLIKATSAYYWTSQKKLEALLEPVAAVLRSEMSQNCAFRGVLVHVFSNGGGFQLMTLRKVLQRSPVLSEGRSALKLPTALILDSAPGDNALSSSIKSFTPPNRFLYLLALPPIAVLYAAFCITNFLGGHPPIFAELRATLNSLNLLPFITGQSDTKETPRLYIFSDGDRIVSAGDVSAHIEVAVSQGFRVDIEKFSDSQHVSHARKDPQRYWSAIKRHWSNAVAESAQFDVAQPHL